jgi:hypothetical protein
MSKKKSPKKPNTMTISAFAMAILSDRRTVARRLLANGVAPIGKQNGYDVYRLADLSRVMADDLRTVPVRVSDDDDNDIDGSRDLAIISIGEEIPQLIEVMVKDLGLQLDRKRLDELAYNTWLALAKRIEADAEELPSGSLLEHVDRETIFELPMALQPVAFRLGIKEIPKGMKPDWFPLVEDS